MKKTILLSLLVFLAACNLAPEIEPTLVPPTPTKTQVPPTSTPTATPTPTQTPLPVTNISATVWENDPFAVVLTYHQFAENIGETSNSVKVRYEDFGIQLQALYDSGYSLIPLEDWMNGNMVVPEGRIPLIFSMDDLFFRNQILLDENGEIDPHSGMGLHWEFYQENPDFGFSWSLFTNLGDKLYPVGDDPNWREVLAEAIAWCFDHDSPVYNHTYQHPNLSNAKTAYLKYQLSENDLFLRELLVMAGREDIIPQLKNIIGLPFGAWPLGYNGYQALMNYTTPEDVPLQGVMEIDYIVRVEYLPPMYHEDYDPFAMPRVAANPSAVVWLISNTAEFEQAQTCDLGKVPDIYLNDDAYLAEHIATTYLANECSEGVYIVNNFSFRVIEGEAELISTWDD